MLRLCALILFISVPAFADVPEPIKELIAKQSEEFKRVLMPLDQGQRRLVLAHYVEEFLSSPVTRGYHIDKDELARFVHQMAPHEEAGESQGKKSKTHTIKDEHAEEYVSALLKAFNGVMEGDVLKLRIDCEGEEFLVPFQVASWKDFFDVRLNGIGIPQNERYDPTEENHCLLLDLSPGKPLAQLSYLTSRESACPIPLVKAGECLLNAAERMSKAVGKIGIRAQDVSERKCSLNKEVVSLRRLRIYQRGQGWYESRGFRPEKDEGAVNEDLDLFKAYPLKTFLQQLDRLVTTDMNEHVKEIVKDKSGEFFFFADNDAPTVAQFMAWLWDDDCVAYGIVDAFVFGESSRLSVKGLYRLPEFLVKPL